MPKIYDDIDDGDDAANTKKTEQQNDGPTGVILWDLAIDKLREKEESASSEVIEKNVIFVGCRDAGKTSIILNFTEGTTEALKPTNALDYRFIRKAKSDSSVLKLVGNIWELGEGTFLLKLIDVVVNPENLINTSVVITVDLSKPQEIWITLETVIAYLKQRIKECVKEAHKHNSTIKDRLKRSIIDRLKGSLDKLDPLALPTAIVATKYDQFEKMEPEYKKIIAKTLRFVSHYYGTALIFSSNKNEITSRHLKSLLNSFLFDGTFQAKHAQVDHTKPLFVPFGMDSFESIGLPPLSPAELNDPTHKDLIDLWKYLFCKHFPQEESAKRDPLMIEDYGKGHQFEEPVIDVLKEQKMRELDNIREVLKKRRSQVSETTKFQIIN